MTSLKKLEGKIYHYPLNKIHAELRRAKDSFHYVRRKIDFENRYRKGVGLFDDLNCEMDKKKQIILLCEKELERRGVFVKKDKIVNHIRKRSSHETN